MGWKTYSGLILLCAIQLCFTDKTTTRHASRELVEEEKLASKDNKVLKPYEFGYEIQDPNNGNHQERHEKSDEHGAKTGSYGYMDANGVYRKVVYTADKNGFRVKEIKSNEPGLNTKPISTSSSRKEISKASSPSGYHHHKENSQLIPNLISPSMSDMEINNQKVREQIANRYKGSKRDREKGNQLKGSSSKKKHVFLSDPETYHPPKLTITPTTTTPSSLTLPYPKYAMYPPYSPPTPRYPAPDPYPNLISAPSPPVPSSGPPQRPQLPSSSSYASSSEPNPFISNPNFVTSTKSMTKDIPHREYDYYLHSSPLVSPTMAPSHPSFPYPFVSPNKKERPNSYESNPSLLQSSHSVPTYQDVNQGVSSNVRTFPYEMNPHWNNRTMYGQYFPPSPNQKPNHIPVQHHHPHSHSHSHPHDHSPSPQLVPPHLHYDTPKYPQYQPNHQQQPPPPSYKNNHHHHPPPSQPPTLSPFSFESTRIRPYKDPLTKSPSSGSYSPPSSPSSSYTHPLPIDGTKSSSGANSLHPSLLSTNNDKYHHHHNHPPHMPSYNHHPLPPPYQMSTPSPFGYPVSTTTMANNHNNFLSPYTTTHYTPKASTIPYTPPSSPFGSLPVTSESPFSASSADRPYKYLDGPNPGGLLKESVKPVPKLEPSVTYADDDDNDQVYHNRIPNTNEHLPDYVRHQRDKLHSQFPLSPPPPPPPPPPSSTTMEPLPIQHGDHHHHPYGDNLFDHPHHSHYSPPPPLFSQTQPPPPYPSSSHSDARSRLASYYQSVKSSPVIHRPSQPNDVPSVLLGIQSAIGLEKGPNYIPHSSSDPSLDNYSPSHYPSYDQIMLLRKGLRKLIPILHQSGSSSTLNSSKKSLSPIFSSSASDMVLVSSSDQDGTRYNYGVNGDLMASNTDSSLSPSSPSSLDADDDADSMMTSESSNLFT